MRLQTIDCPAFWVKPALSRASVQDSYRSGLSIFEGRILTIYM